MIACHACGGALAPRFDAVVDPQTRETFAIVACARCGLGHTSPQPDDLAPYYGAQYHGNRHGITARYCAARRARIVASVAGPAGDRALLDIGCGDGTFLFAARARGWRVAGTEANARIARDAGLAVYDALDDVPREPLGCATLWHSLEHLRDPAATIAALADRLAPDGTLVVAVPDAEGLQARMFGARWFHLDVPRHLFHFGARSLARLVEAAGLRVVRRWHQELEYDLLGWSQSALNAVMPQPNVLFARLTGKPVPAGGHVAANVALGAALTALAIPATAAATLARRGGTLVVAARRA